MISLNLKNLSCVKIFIVDGSYSGKNFESAVKEIQGAEVNVVKKSDLHRFQLVSKRWIVERTFGLPDKNRRLVIPIHHTTNDLLFFFCKSF